MNNEIVISPKELYYLGCLMQAKYIDYAYVAAMDDIGQNFALYESETKASLVSAGILQEDFSGNTEVDAGVEALLKPLFFGEKESSIDVCTIGEENTVTVNKFHFHDDAITMVTGAGGKLLLKAVDLLGIQQLIEALLPADYAVETAPVAALPRDGFTRFIAVKNICVGKIATVKTYIEADDIVYQEDGDKAESVSREDFMADVSRIVKEA